MITFGDFCMRLAYFCTYHLSLFLAHIITVDSILCTLDPFMFRVFIEVL
jgi:hypothetical protein